ncbi:MAG: hypothetical protein ACFFDN_47145 [Candidatus Hodarchaeota archaeon]
MNEDQIIQDIKARKKELEDLTINYEEKEKNLRNEIQNEKNLKQALKTLNKTYSKKKKSIINEIERKKWILVNIYIIPEINKEKPTKGNKKMQLVIITFLFSILTLIVFFIILFIFNLVKQPILIILLVLSILVYTITTIIIKSQLFIKQSSFTEDWEEQIQKKLGKESNNK